MSTNITLSDIKDKFNEENNQVSGALLDPELRNELDSKQPKEQGKGLSTNDFTNILKERLEGLTNYDDTELSNKLATLESNLNTILNDENATTVIDTFQEIETFLQGITNTETLTGLLQDLKSDIIGLCNNSYISKTQLSDGIIGSVNQQGWYRIVILGTEDSMARSILFSISSNYYNYVPESYTFSINITYDNKVSITQLSGEKTINAFDRIRILSKNSDISYIDLHVASSKYNNIRIVGFGKNAIFQEATLVSEEIPEGYTATEFETTNGFKTNSELSADSAKEIKIIELYNEDLNNLKDKAFKSYSAPAANICTNTPVSGYFSLQVFNASDNRTIQIFTSNNGTTYKRYFNNISWTSWVQLADVNSTVAAANQVVNKYLTNEDLNNIIDTNYTVYKFDSNNSITNLPFSKGYAGSLIVFGYNSNHIVQLAFNYSNGADVLYKRIKVGGTWLSWKRMLSEDDFPVLTQAEYDALTTKDANKIYLIKE